jgi:hypothetical protein
MRTTDKYKTACFLKDRALEMVQRHGSTLRMPDYGIALECARPSFRIFYTDPETTPITSPYHHLDVYADGRGREEGRRVKVFSVAWIPDAALEVITFKRGLWEQVFLS